ncbi:ribonuclease HII [Loktanella sp. SALINAS62]|uniref:ribonuclease HII n=1 Tax=Loktanella sp. SALINAS62 TaxID=2706124 RepID=UPI001B8BA6AC|nr:ribonuclease HII [Loktanella sp. SALINAS62]MBS1302314.1 ribonuclease HII [Loktanella sp. SALINAS62]
MTRTTPDFSFETSAAAHGYLQIAGVDEVGRGPIAGPVVAAAVILNPDHIPAGLNDSKCLTARKRDSLYDEIQRMAFVGIAQATVSEIEEHNILRASHLAMIRALAALPVCPDYALIDGNMLPRNLPCPAMALVKGDARSQSIAAASIMAKVWRDRLMVGLAQQHPGYGWDRNAGYPTPEHKEGLKCNGVTLHHRRAFAPIRNILWQEKNP